MSEVCPKCGSNLAACTANGCPSDMKPLPEIEQLRTANYLLNIELTRLKERLVVAEGLIAGLLKMADDAMAAWGIAALHGIGLTDEKTAREKEDLKDAARAFLTPTPTGLVVVRRDHAKRLAQLWSAEGRYYQDYREIADSLKAALKEEKP